MPISKTNDVFLLVKSLTIAEKRHFKSYSQRNQSGKGLKFLKLFDVIDKQKVSNDELIFNELKDVSKSQYANLKRHLYSQILSSLKIINKSKHPNIQIREYIDFADTLYGKGLYLQALKILEIAKREAKKYHFNYMHLTIIEFEKQIEMRHITRSGSEKVGQLVTESNETNKRVSDTIYLSNLRIELHGMYIRNGHSRNDKQQAALQKYFNKKIKQVDRQSLGIVECIYLFQSYVWFHFIQLDFESCRYYANEWIKLFDDNPELIDRDINLLMRAYHYHLSSSYHLNDHFEFEKKHEELERLRKEKYKILNSNSQIISFLYVHSGRLDKIILSGSFEKGQEVIPRTLKRIQRYRNKLDSHRILVFYFKIAWIYFGNKEIDKSIQFLNRIVNQEMQNLREDIQIYARLLFLMCHYEINNFDTINYLMKGFANFFKKISEQYPLQLVTHDLFKKITSTPLADHKKIFKNTFVLLNELAADPFQRTSLRYLDVFSWVQSKVERKTLASVIKG